MAAVLGEICPAERRFSSYLIRALSEAGDCVCSRFQTRVNVSAEIKTLTQFV